MARGYEAQEDWRRALAEYEAALRLDPTVAFALEGRERSDVDAVEVHRHDQPADAAMLGRGRVGADEQLAVVGHLCEGRPDLVPAHDVVIAVALGLRLQARQV